MATQQEVRTTLGERLKQFLDDVTSLEVLTLTGDIKLTGAGAGGGQSVKLDNLMTAVAQGMTPGANNTIKIVAYTKAQFDCDSINYMIEGATPEQQALIESHRKTVEAAHRSRFEALKFIGDAVKSLT